MKKNKKKREIERKRRLQLGVFQGGGEEMCEEGNLERERWFGTWKIQEMKKEEALEKGKGGERGRRFREQGGQIDRERETGNGTWKMRE